MKKKNITVNMAYAALWLLATIACTDESGVQTGTTDEYTVHFTATLQSEEKIETRGPFDNEKGEVTALPYINAISILNVHSSIEKTETPYNVKTANKGVLEYQGEAENSLKWEPSHLNESADFYAWTTPTGVGIDPGDKSGTINFVTGNTYNSNPGNEDKLNNVAVTPLEVFISAISEDNKYNVSPSVTLPFFHPVSKVSIYLRNWDNQHINQANATNVAIEFLSIPEKWKIKQTTSGDKKAFSVTEPQENDNSDLKLNFSDLIYNSSTGYFTMYLPPLTKALSTDFATAGDFCITYGGKQFYGTLASILSQKNIELAAGQHMAIQMDLSENYGVGIGAYIVKWQGPDKEEIAYANPNRGIYSTEGFQCLVDFLKNKTPDKTLSDTLYIEENNQKIIRLYNNLTITDEMAADLLGADLQGITFDGQGYTITLPAGSNSLFSTVGDDTDNEETVIKNLYLAGAGEITGQGMLANTATNITIENCHILKGSIASSSGAAGGLIGTANTGTELSYCSSLIPVSSTDDAAGGLIGEVTSGATNVVIKGCYTQSLVTAGNGSYAGGLIGNMQTGTMTDSYFCFGNGADITGGNHLGILAGNSNGATIENCYWGVSDELTTTLEPVGDGTEAITCYAFLVEPLTQKEDDPEEHDVTYPTGTLGTFNNGSFKAETMDNGTIKTLLNVLKTNTGKDWVWIYGKDYPIVKIK